MLLSGIFPPITTPFYPDGNVYHKKLEANVEHYSRTPVAGIVVLGSTGEAILLSDEERRFDRTIRIGLKKLDDDLNPLRAEKWLAETPEQAQAELEKIGDDPPNPLKSSRNVMAPPPLAVAPMLESSRTPGQDDGPHRAYDFSLAAHNFRISSAR